jgi:alkylation response protein AidB-like acyl-CoA dehydrogenase
MDFSISEEQGAISELARQIMSDHVTHERLKELERSSEGFDPELWAKLAEANLLGTALPEDVGGMGLGFFEVCLILQEQGRHVAPVPLIPTLVLGGLPIAEFGSTEQQQRLLQPVATQEGILSAALNEVGIADPARPRVTAKAQGSSWRLDGVKVCVPAADQALRLLVPAASGDGEIGVFLLDPNASGSKLARQDTTNGEPQFLLELTGAEVGPQDVLGDPHAGESIVRWLEERALVALAAVQLGVAEEALKRTAEYTANRKQFGRPIGAFQGVSMRAADAYIDVEAMRSTLWQALWRLEQGLSASCEVSVAKWWACRGGQRVALSAQHLHGGIGSDLDYPLHRYFLWARQVELTLGGASRHLARIGSILAAEGVE